MILSCLPIFFLKLNIPELTSQTSWAEGYGATSSARELGCGCQAPCGWPVSQREVASRRSCVQEQHPKACLQGESQGCPGSEVGSLTLPSASPHPLPGHMGICWVRGGTLFPSGAPRAGSNQTASGRGSHPAPSEACSHGAPGVGGVTIPAPGSKSQSPGHHPHPCSAQCALWKLGGHDSSLELGTQVTVGDK